MRKLILYFIVCFWSVSLHAQDPNFSLFYNNPTYYNPAMAAINKGFTFRANMRNQWMPIPGRFNTYGLSFEGEIVNNLSMGLNAFSDVAGEGFLRTSGGVISYSYCPIQNPNHILQFGMSGGYISKYVDWTRLTFSDQYDEVLGKIYNSNFIPPDNATYNYVDLGSGLAYQFFYDTKTNGFFRKLMLNVGASMNHLNRPKDAYFSGNDYIPIKSVLHTKNQILLGNYVYTFAGIFEYQNKFVTRTLGLNFQLKSSLNFGFWSRSGMTINNQRFESYISTVGFIIPIKKIYQLRCTYSIDFTLTKLRTSSFGSHEISLVYMLDDKFILKRIQEKRRKKDMFRCPDDFKGFR
jgi:type IX secretion system PorP/SprF family membrane protein